MRNVPTASSGRSKLYNTAVREALDAHAGAYWIDADACLGRVGEKAYYDLRYWHIGGAPSSLAAVREIADEIVRFVRALKGKNKKVLVLDCDNVLWGGTIGEDGLEGIRLGHTSPVGLPRISAGSRESVRPGNRAGAVQQEQ